MTVVRETDAVREQLDNEVTGCVIARVADGKKQLPVRFARSGKTALLQLRVPFGAPRTGEQDPKRGAPLTLA